MVGKDTRTRRMGRTLMDRPKTLVEKVWEKHVVRSAEGEPDLIYVDLHLVHEVTSPQAFEGIRLAGRGVRRPELTLATMDHNVPTSEFGLPIEDKVSAKQMEALRSNCEEFGIKLNEWGSIGQGGGVGHVIEYRGEAVRQLSMEGRMTVCNMSIEGGARAGLVAPDETTFSYLEGREHAPEGEDWERALEYWKTLP